MPVVAAAIPLLPGKSEAWRRWVQELQESRRADYAAFLSRLGVLHARFWIAEMASGEVVVSYLDVKDPIALTVALEMSQHPFDIWYRQQLREFHGADVGPFYRWRLDQVIVWPNRE